MINEVLVVEDLRFTVKRTFVYAEISKKAFASIDSDDTNCKGNGTVAGEIDLVSIAKSCGYAYAKTVETFDDLDRELKIVKNRNELCFLEVKSAIGARDDLGRPTTTAEDNKIEFMARLQRD